MAPQKTPEEVMLEFIRGRIQSSQGLNLQKLTGHLSQLPQEIRSHCGCSVKALKDLLAQHPDTFYIDSKSNVWPADRRPKMTSAKISVENVAASNGDSEQKEVTTLNKVKGVVYRLFPVFGFINVKEPIAASVYFDVQVFEGGKHRNLSSSGLQVGEAVELNAKIGPSNCEAKYRASQVWRPGNKPLDLDELGNDREVNTTGLIQKLFNQYGFIKFGKGMRERAFFHVNNIVKPPNSTIYSLTEVLKIDEPVLFRGKPSEKENNIVKWEAIEVRIKCFEKNEENFSVPSDDESGEEVFMSDSDEDDYDTYAEWRFQKSDDLNLECVLKSGDNEDPFPLDRAATNRHSTHTGFSWDKLPKRSSEIGTFNPETDNEGKILFGDKKQYSAYVCNDVFYMANETVSNFLWEVNEGTKTNFDAVEYEGTWVTTLAWVGNNRPSQPSVEQSVDSFIKCLTKFSPVLASKLNIPTDSARNLTKTSSRTASPRSLNTIPTRTPSPAGSYTSNRSAWSNKGKDLTQPSVDIYQSVSGTVDKVLDYLGYIKFNKRKILFMDRCVYINGEVARNLPRELHEGDDVNFNYISFKDEKGELQEEASLVWKGKKPKNAKEMTPDEFLKKNSINLTLVQEGAMSAFIEDSRSQNGSNSAASFGWKDVDSEKSPSLKGSPKLSSPTTSSRSRSSAEKGFQQGSADKYMDFKPAQQSSGNLPNMPPTVPNFFNPSNFESFIQHAYQGSPLIQGHNGPGVSDEMLRKLAKMVSEELRDHLLIPRKGRDVGVQTVESALHYAAESGASNGNHLADAACQTISTGNVTYTNVYTH